MSGITNRSSRELEIAQLELALRSTEEARKRAAETLLAVLEKHAAQSAELRFQRLLAKREKGESK